MSMWSREGSNESAAAVFPGYGTGTETVPVRFIGSQDVISRIDSETGCGVSIPEVDRLDIQPTGANLITGSNHALWYAKTGSTTFTRESGDLMFSTLKKNRDGTYTLTSATGRRAEAGKEVEKDRQKRGGKETRTACVGVSRRSRRGSFRRYGSVRGPA
jgi:hypothetical protein